MQVSTRGPKGALFVVVLALAVSGSSLTSAGAGARARLLTRSDRTIAPGLTLTKINDPSGPYQIRILTVEPSFPITIDMAAAGPLPSLAPTSAMAQSDGAIAAINGDFGAFEGRPLHAFAVDGQLDQTGFQNGASFAISHDELHTYIQPSHVGVHGKNRTTGATFGVDLWNQGPPGPDQIAGFTKYGGKQQRPPSSGCLASLKRGSAIHWYPGQQGVFRNYTVVAESCSAPVTFGKRGVAILASKPWGTGAATLQALVPGASVRIGWRVVGTSTWTGAMEMMGGMPLLVDNGAVVARNNCGTYFCDLNPRTGIGVTADGKVLLVTVDGRAPGISIGMTLSGFAKYMLSLGAVYAVNMDGGGSTAMWVSGTGLVNRPSDSTGERSVPNAILVLPGADPNEPTPLHRLVAVRSASATRSAELEATDPGSTGGLLNALASGAFGYHQSLPHELQGIANEFARANTTS